jgi:hydroxyethylthiazole kinase
VAGRRLGGGLAVEDDIGPPGGDDDRPRLGGERPHHVRNARVALAHGLDAAETGAVVVASGRTDIVADGEGAYELAVGHERMGSFVGSGCMLASTLGTLSAVVGEGDGPPASTTGAARAACVAYGIAGERAAERDPAGPASYRTAFMDAVAELASERPALDAASRIEEV